MTSTVENIPRPVSGWKRLLNWMKAIEGASDHDPVERSLSHLNRRISALEDTIFEREPRVHTPEGAIR